MSCEEKSSGAVQGSEGPGRSVGELVVTGHLSGLKARRKVERGLSGSSTF